MPVATMIAGPNGSGKSSLYKHFRAHGVHFGRYFNADDIAQGLSGDALERSLIAQELVRSGRANELASGNDYCWETVMSHVSHIEHLSEARKAGYETRLLYIALEDPALNVCRVAERVASGGHDVPRNRVEKRYFRSISKLSLALTVANHSRVFDNSSRDNHFRLIASVDDGKMALHQDWLNTPRWFIPALVDLQAV